MVDVRPPVPGDADRWAALLADPAVGRTLGGVFTRERSDALLAHDLEHWARDGWGPWACFADGAFAGRGGLQRCPLGIEILYAVPPSLWGRGVATAIAIDAVAFARELDLHAVVGYAWIENPASIRVLEKAGLVFEREFEHAGLPHWLGRLALNRREPKPDPMSHEVKRPQHQLPTFSTPPPTATQSGAPADFGRRRPRGWGPSAPGPTARSSAAPRAAAPRRRPRST